MTQPDLSLHQSWYSKGQNQDQCKKPRDTHSGPRIMSNFLMARAFNSLKMNTLDDVRGVDGRRKGAGTDLYFRSLQSP